MTWHPKLYTKLKHDWTFTPMSLVQRISEINPLLDVRICVRVVGGICVKEAKVICFADDAQIGTNLEIKKLGRG